MICFIYEGVGFPNTWNISLHLVHRKTIGLHSVRPSIVLQSTSLSVNHFVMAMFSILHIIVSLRHWTWNWNNIKRKVDRDIFPRQTKLGIWTHLGKAVCGVKYFIATLVDICLEKWRIICITRQYYQTLVFMHMSKSVNQPIQQCSDFPMQCEMTDIVYATVTVYT